MDLRAGPRADEPGNDDGEDQICDDDVEEPLETPVEQMAAAAMPDRRADERTQPHGGGDVERQLELRLAEKDDQPAPFDAAIMDQLPARRYEGGERTHGVLSSADGRRESLVSGYDGPWRQLPQEHRRIPNRYTITSHVEAHAVARMWLDDIEDATLHINNAPCGGRMGCDVNLPKMLPPNAKLTVWFPGTTGPTCRTFTGSSAGSPEPRV